MKRILWIFVLVALLCGCTELPQTETTLPLVQTTQAVTDPTEPVGIYVPYSDLEIQTNGAVRYYLPQDPNCYGLIAMGSDLLVFSGNQTTTLYRLSGEKLFTVASAQLGCRVDPQDPSFQLGSNGITYFNPNTWEVIFLDKDLKEVSRIDAPEEMVGSPVLSANRMQMYYCSADAVRVYDLETGLDRLLKEVSYPEQCVQGIYLEDSVLRCQMRDEQGEEHAMFLSTATGEIIDQVWQPLELTTLDERYYAVVPEGLLWLHIFGNAREEPQVLIPRDPDADAWFLEKENRLITATVTEEETILDCYDLDSGMLTHTIALPAGLTPRCVESKGADGVYVMGYDYMADQTALCLWQLPGTEAVDATVYTSPRFTAENPDKESLAFYEEYAGSIGAPHGVEILVGEAAVRNPPEDYILELEYQIPVIREQLETLDRLLEQFPQGFFEKIYGVKKICVVRSITGAPVSGNLDRAQGIQYWNGNDAYIVLTVGESLEYAFFHEMFHIIDNKVLSDTRAYYYWHNLNPAGFGYYWNYTSYLTGDNSEYLQEESRAFIDEYSMCYPREDRARIMEYACNPGNAHYFSSEIMQQKLLTLCKGIREAFGLKDYDQPLLWEQYLNEPLTP